MHLAANLTASAAAHCHLQQKHRFWMLFATPSKTMKNSLLQRNTRHGTDNAAINHENRQILVEQEELNHAKYNNQPTKKSVRRHALCRSG